MVNEGVDVRIDSDYALCFAAEHGYLEVVKFLVELGANVNAGNNWAIDHAVDGDHLCVLDYLVKHSKEVIKPSSYKLSCLRARGCLETVSYLENL
jgi:ankyrin repeat protein